MLCVQRSDAQADREIKIGGRRIVDDRNDERRRRPIHRWGIARQAQAAGDAQR